MMLTDFILAMILVCSIYASDCDFELAKTGEDIYFSQHMPFMLNCDPVYKFDPDICSLSPIYKWSLRHEEIVPKQGKRKLLANHQRLLVFDGDRSDEGQYSCDTHNYRGPLNRTFTARMTDPSAMQKLLLPNAFPHEASGEKTDEIYWLPEMLLGAPQQTMVRNPGDSAELFGYYYVSAEISQIESFNVHWVFHSEEINATDLEHVSGYKIKTFNSPCNDLDVLPRVVNGSCFSNRLYMININIKTQGYYQSEARLLLKNGIARTLNFTYRININQAQIIDHELNQVQIAQMIFNHDTKLCVNDAFNFNCKVSPDGSFITMLYKIYPNMTFKLLSKSEIDEIKIQNELGKISSNAVIIRSSQIQFRIASVTPRDAGVYECRAFHMSLIQTDARSRLETIEKMVLTVKQCADKSDYAVILWSVVPVCLVIVILVLIMIVYRYYFKYSNGYLVKTVIVQHPNKLYVPHDTCCPLIMPDVSVKTVHKHMDSSDNSLIPQKPFSRIVNVPFTQKISKYLRKSFPFSYRHVDLSGSSPDPKLMVISNNDINRLASNSLRVESPRPQLILQNDSHTKYILPSNIGWIFSRDSLIIGSKIGEGAFGIVYTALIKPFSDSSAPVEVAIKTLHASFGDEDVINLIKELEMMKLIGHHRHIISLYGACVDNGHPYMVIELAKHGNLRDFLRERRHNSVPGTVLNGTSLVKPSLTVADLLRFSLEIAQGMEFLSSRMIIHRDLAARNVLVDQYLEMKIADFGLTRAVEHYYRKTTDGRLPIKWMAPECLLDRIYTVKSDVWSFGIVLWEIFSMGETPYPTIQSDAMHQALRNGVRNDKPFLSSPEIYKLMLIIWNDDPQDRYSFAELVEKLTHIKLLEPNDSPIQRDYLEISSNQCYSMTVV